MGALGTPIGSFGSVAVTKPIPPPATILFQRPGAELSVESEAQTLWSFLVAQGVITSQSEIAVAPDSELPINPVEEGPTGPGGQTWLPWEIRWIGASPSAGALDLPDVSAGSLLKPTAALPYCYSVLVGLLIIQLNATNGNTAPRVEPDGSVVIQ